MRDTLSLFLTYGKQDGRRWQFDFIFNSETFLWANLIKSSVKYLGRDVNKFSFDRSLQMVMTFTFCVCQHEIFRPTQKENNCLKTKQNRATFISQFCSRNEFYVAKIIIISRGFGVFRAANGRYSQPVSRPLAAYCGRPDGSTASVWRNQFTATIELLRNIFYFFFLKSNYNERYNLLLYAGR